MIRFLLLLWLLLVGPVWAQNRAVAIVPPGKGDSDKARRIALMMLRSPSTVPETSRSKPEIYEPETYQEMFALMRSWKSRPISLLIIVGHGSFESPHVEFRKILGKENNALGQDEAGFSPRWRERIEAQGMWDANCRKYKVPTLPETTIRKLSKEVTDLLDVSQCMEPGAQVLMVNCSAAQTDEGKEYCRDMGNLLVGFHGGSVRASTVDVGVGMKLDARNPAASHWEMTGEWLNFPIAARGLRRGLELSEISTGAGYRDGEEAVLKIGVRGFGAFPSEPLPVTLHVFNIPVGSSDEAQQSLARTLPIPVEARQVVNLSRDGPAVAEFRMKPVLDGPNAFCYLVECPGSEPLVGHIEYKAIGYTKKLELLGASLSPANPRPGDMVHLNLAYRITNAPTSSQGNVVHDCKQPGSGGKNMPVQAPQGTSTQHFTDQLVVKQTGNFDWGWKLLIPGYAPLEGSIPYTVEDKRRLRITQFRCEPTSVQAGGTVNLIAEYLIEGLAESQTVINKRFYLQGAPGKSVGQVNTSDLTQDTGIGHIVTQAMRVDADAKPGSVLAQIRVRAAGLEAIKETSVTVKPPADDGAWKLKGITVERVYAWNPPTGCVSPGAQSLPPSGAASVNFGWNGNFKSGLEEDDAGKCNYQGVNNVGAVLTVQAPPIASPGSTISLAAGLQGNWNLRGYGVARDHTIVLSGDAGEKKQTVGEKLNGQFAANVASGRSVTVPSSGNGFVCRFSAEIRFGGDNWGRANVTLQYGR